MTKPRIRNAASGNGLPDAVSMPTTAARADDADSPLFPEAYGIIGRERYMFPADMSDWALKIDGRHQLFVDDYLVSSMSGLWREHHQLKPHPANPVYTPSERMAYPVYVMQAENGLYRMWYLQRIVYKDEDGNTIRYPTAYLESHDGIRWIEPTIGPTRGTETIHACPREPCRCVGAMNCGSTTPIADTGSAPARNRKMRACRESESPRSGLMDAHRSTRAQSPAPSSRAR